MTDSQAPTLTPIETLDNLYRGIYDELALAGKQVRTIQDSLKTLSREFRVLDRQNKARKKRPQPQLNLSKELSTFLSIDQGTTRTKAEVMKDVSSYIKEKNLQVAENKRQFVPNKQLAKIFNIKKPSAMTFVEINKHVSHHLTR
jgi:chromatin remodeling complex protein RSC6